MIRIKHNVNVLEYLKEKGMTTYQLRKKRIFGESRIQRMREGKTPSIRELDLICKLTAHDINDLIEYVPDPAQ